jgi:hypothetical protein
MIRLIAIAVMAFVGGVHAQPAVRHPPTTLVAPKIGVQRVDSRGFIHRWLLLEPIPVTGKLTDSAVSEAIQEARLPGLPDMLPREGDTVTANGTMARWHARDTLHYNVNLYHFAWALSKPTTNVLFWVATTVESPDEMHNVRLSIGSNAASRWWLNGELVVALNDDRQTVIDDGVSRRLTLRKGRNVIRAAIINGGGATDFCARFLDADDKPIKMLKTPITPRD